MIVVGREADRFRGLLVFQDAFVTTSTNSNLDFSAYLLARGFVLQRIEPDADGKRCLMVFQIAPEQLAALESAYLQGAQVPAVALLSSLRRLRKAMDAVLGKNNVREQH